MSNFKGNKEYPKVPVRYRDKPLMPTTWRKALRLMKEKKAILVKDKVLGLYLKLKYKPKTTYTQPVYLGIDPGSMFDGYSVVSKSGKLDNRNFQFNHQLPIQGKLKGLVNGRKGNRRVRRGRLRHRESRFDSRIGNRVSNTANYYFQNRRNMIERIMKIYPISHICIEDVKFSKKDKGNSSSNIEIGKKRLYDYVLDTLDLILIKAKGFDTKEMRETLFPKFNKTRNKAYRGFEAHCIDSLTLAIMGYLEATEDYRTVSKLPVSKMNTTVRFIDGCSSFNRRCLFKFKSKQKNSKLDENLPYYFRYGKGGIKIPFLHKSKLKKIRVKFSEKIKPNHGKIWRYEYTDPKPTLKCHLSPYGGTIIKIGSKCKGSIGDSKYWNGKFYKYYNIRIV